MTERQTDDATAGATATAPPNGATEPAATAAEPAKPAVPACSIVIPVHNKAALTRTCVNALLNERDPKVAREVVVVDDGSADLTPQLLDAFGDRIRVVRHEPAAGFAAACNAGAAAASHDYLVFLNNDTIPRAGWLSALVRYAEEHPEAAMVGAKLLFPNDTVQHAGVVFGVDRLPHHLYAGFPADHAAVNKSRPFPAVTAACCLVHRADWDALGGFDTDYVNGWEDVDFCLRVRARGREVHYCHESVVYHFESTTRDLRAPQERANRDRFVERWDEAIVPDDFAYYLADGLIRVDYAMRQPMQVAISPLLAGVKVGDEERLGDRLLFERARQVAILLRNNIILNLRVQEAELKAQAAEARARAAEGRLAGLGEAEPHLPDGAAVALDAALPETAADAAAAAPAALPPLAAPPEPEPPPTHPILGRVEQPGRTPDVVTESVLAVRGWALSKAGIFLIETLVDGVERGVVDYGQPRPDVVQLFPGFPDGEECGFTGGVPVGDLADGSHALTIRIVGRDGRAAALSTNFELDSTARATGRILARRDQPPVDQPAVASDHLRVGGWALSSRGIRDVATFVDGEPAGRISYGLLRPDVGASHPDFPDADHCGFTGLIPVAGLPDGAHEAVIRITSETGDEHELTVPFEVAAGGGDVGEVPAVNRQYAAWLDRHAPNEAEIERLRSEVAALPTRPIVGLILPLAGADAAALEATVASIAAQTYDGWRLVIVADPSSPAAKRAETLAAGDVRVSVVGSPKTDFAAAVNAGLAWDGGDWVAVVAAGDRLDPRALGELVRAMDAEPDADVLYVDEDRVDGDGTRWDPFFKPDWSPDLLLSTDYLGPFTLVRRTVWDELGGPRAGFAGAERYDLALRATERARVVGHVPRMLYSRAGSPAAAAAPPDGAGVAAERRALVDALARRGIDGGVEPGISPGRWRVCYALDGRPGVTVVMPSGGKMQFLRPCLDDLLNRTTYPNLSVLVMDNSTGYDVANLCEELAPRHPRLRRRPIELAPFNFSALINRALPFVDTPYVLLLNDDITVLTPDWVEAMLEHAQRPEVGVVGAKLLYPEGTIQHAGVIFGPYHGTGHAFKQFPGDEAGYFGLPNVIRNYAAVTFACALLRTSIFAEVGGLDEENLPIAFNDADFCLRVVDAGYRIVYTPHAALYHHESVTKTVIAKPAEIGLLRSRWGRFIAHDPFYNPNLTRKAEDFSLNMD